MLRRFLIPLPSAYNGVVDALVLGLDSKLECQDVIVCRRRIKFERESRSDTALVAW